MTWTHAICSACWKKSHPGQEPCRVKNDGFVKCCFCSASTNAGIYVRHNPNELECKHKDE